MRNVIDYIKDDFQSEVFGEGLPSPLGWEEGEHSAECQQKWCPDAAVSAHKTQMGSRHHRPCGASAQVFCVTYRMRGAAALASQTPPPIPWTPTPLDSWLPRGALHPEHVHSPLQD